MNIKCFLILNVKLYATSFKQLTRICKSIPTIRTVVAVPEVDEVDISYICTTSGSLTLSNDFFKAAYRQ